MIGNNFDKANPASIHHFENFSADLSILLPFQFPSSSPLGVAPPYRLGGLRRPEKSKQSRGQLFQSEAASSGSPSAEQVPAAPALDAVNGSGKDHQNQSPSNPLINPHHHDNNNTNNSVSLCSISHLAQRLFRAGSSPSCSTSHTDGQLFPEPPPSHRKGRVSCGACSKSFYDKGTLKIHYNAVHLKIKHRCTVDGCSMVFSSLRSRNRHSANPNPRLHTGTLRHTPQHQHTPLYTPLNTPQRHPGSEPAGPSRSDLHSGPMFPRPGYLSGGLAVPLSPLETQLTVPSLGEVPQLLRLTLQTSSPPLPCSFLLTPPRSSSSPLTALLPPLPSSSSLPDQSDDSLGSVGGAKAGQILSCFSTDPTPKKKPRKSSMPLKIETKVMVADECKGEGDEEVTEKEGKQKW
ncbi:hypothetical protein DPEC_G00106260 [Dallia pectoralis]|uniref:Uncharacterized protein n=1 Tax=Dallia pectoralis TaxID=75939 RepID=A0ACC2GYL7_DALPE|nr:hypothetical protein DPEC_G00106260 [Dallia pectoralis]